jgi:hypothetical protein
LFGARPRVPHARIKTLAAAAALVAALALLPDQAFGDSCLEQVRGLAAAHGPPPIRR